MKRRPPDTRLREVDVSRGIAVSLMVFFHLMWNLHFFGWSSVDILGPGWQAFARGIGSGFLVLLGISLALDATRHHRTPRQIWKRNLSRAGTLTLCALLISLVTYGVMGQSFVRFGILHLMAVAIVISTPLVFLPAWSSLVASGLVIIASLFLTHVSAEPNWLLPFGVVPTGLMMVDYYPIIPWLGIALFGIALGKWLYPHSQRRFAFRHHEIKNKHKHDYRLIGGLCWLGRHSLAIYLLHQPVLIGLMGGINGMLGIVRG